MTRRSPVSRPSPHETTEPPSEPRTDRWELYERAVHQQDDSCDFVGTDMTGKRVTHDEPVLT